MPDRDLRTIGIIGAGATGAAVAIYALFGGYRVILEDISAERLAEAKAHVNAALDGAVMGHQSDSPDGREMRASFFVTDSMDDVSRAADLLIEAAPDDAEMQLEIFTLFDKFAKPRAIFSTTARSVSIADLAEMTNCPERCVGLQFPDAGSSDRSLRIIAAPKTAERTLETCAAFARALGFAAVIVSEAAPDVAVREGRKP